MPNPLDTWAVLETMEEDKRHNDSDDSWVLLIPIIGIFLGFAVLERLGFAPTEVWTFLKALVYPSTWDIQKGYELPHLDRAGLMVVSAIALSVATIAIMTVVMTVTDFFGKYSNFLLKVLYFAFYLLQKVIVSIFVVNFMFIIVRTGWHLICGFFVWLN